MQGSRPSSSHGSAVGSAQGSSRKGSGQSTKDQVHVPGTPSTEQRRDSHESLKARAHLLDSRSRARRVGEDMTVQIVDVKAEDEASSANESAEAGSSADSSGTADEDQIYFEEHLETMRMARKSTRMTLAPAKLVESVSSRWSHFSEKMVVNLIESKADVNARLQEPWDRSFEDYEETLGATTLHFAVRRGLIEVTHALIEYKADIDAATEKGITPMMVGVMFNQLASVKILFEEKASVLKKDNMGLCAVDLAVLEGREEMLEAIMQFETDEEVERKEKMVRETQEALREELTSDGEDETIDSTDSPGSPMSHASAVGDATPQRQAARKSQRLRSSHLVQGALRKSGIALPQSPGSPQGAGPRNSASVRKSLRRSGTLTAPGSSPKSSTRQSVLPPTEGPFSPKGEGGRRSFAHRSQTLNTLSVDDPGSP